MGTKGESTMLTLLVAMNTKFNGYAMMVVRVHEETNEYQVMAMVYQNTYEIYKLFPVDCANNEFSSLEYRYDPQTGTVDFVLCNYHLD